MNVYITAVVHGRRAWARRTGGSGPMVSIAWMNDERAATQFTAKEATALQWRYGHEKSPARDLRGIPANRPPTLI